MTAAVRAAVRPAAPTPIRFPPIARTRLDNGLRVWVDRRIAACPSSTATLVVARGTGDDPSDRHGLASLTGDLLDEGAGARDAIALAEAFGRLGTQLDIDVGPDATSLVGVRAVAGPAPDAGAHGRRCRPAPPRGRPTSRACASCASTGCGSSAGRPPPWPIARTSRRCSGRTPTDTAPWARRRRSDAITLDDARRFWRAHVRAGRTRP